MRPEQLPYGHIEQLRLRWTSVDEQMLGSITPGTEALLLFAERESQAMLRIGTAVLGVEGDGRKHQELLADLCTRHFPRVAWVLEAGPEVLTLQVHGFLNQLTMPEMELGVDERALKALERIDGKLGAMSRALRWLDEQFLLETADGKLGFALATSATGDSAFALFGRTARAYIRKVQRSDQTDVLLIDRIVRGRGQEGERLALLTGDVRFVDATVAARLRADTAAQLASLVTSEASFLERWSRYDAIEKQVALRRARKAGWLPYEHVESLPDGRYRFALLPDCMADAAELFKQTLTEEQGLSVEAAAELPAVLLRDMSWAEYEATPRNLDAVPSASFDAKMEFDLRNRRVTLSQRRNEETAPPATGFLVASMRGDKTRLDRRTEAASAIREASCLMPQLGLLLEGQPVPVPRLSNIPELTPSIIRKVFGEYEPTATQRKAIATALNTPDIALIQGPPGTGKTTIIVALVERLQEIWDASDGVQGRLLLSGFQHDAVENAIQRMSVNGLPPIKFGNRPNGGEDDRIDAIISRWCDERSAEMRRNLPPRPASDQQKEISALRQSYLLAPGMPEHTASMLLHVSKLVQHSVPTELFQRLAEIGRKLDELARSARNGDPGLDRAVRCVRALRCEPRTFADDGPRNAFMLQEELDRQSLLDTQTRELLEVASSWLTQSLPPFLEDLRKLRRRLLGHLLPADRTGNAIPRVREDVLELLQDIENHLVQRFSSTRSAADEASWKFLDVLENDPEAVKVAVVSYTSVFAATCQQSARQELAELKGSDGFDTVIVDEAARATPLDLFIPMSRAKRRIILVGDHRQLPHIIDRELESELESAQTEGEREAGLLTTGVLQKSLFEHLFEQLRERQKEDNIPRTVTLDEQYRMHPLLGQFVSDQFYAKHNEGFGSPRPATDFAHALPGYSGPAAWLSVPFSPANKEKVDKSKGKKSRPEEARVLVAELKRLMDSPEGRALSFGVITFYKEQVYVIEEELERFGMVVRTSDEPTEILAPYRDFLLPNGRISERLRFGTVDAFQGMEFDVVFLSMVRSNRMADDTKEKWRGKYGHLTLSNRMCVAMSRQKRLLIVVGDDGMLDSPGAPQAIGPLVEFRKLSEVRDATGI